MFRLLASDIYFTPSLQHLLDAGAMTEAASNGALCAAGGFSHGGGITQ